MKKKNKNPLYAVQNNGKDVALADGIFEYWLKKLGLDNFCKHFQNFLHSLMQDIHSYSMLETWTKALELWINNMKILMENFQVFYAMASKRR